MSRFRTPNDAIEDPTGFDPPIYPQAQVDPVDFDIIDQQGAGEGVLSGCLVTESSPNALTVDVASGQVVIGGTIVNVASQPDVAIATPNLTQPRQDLVVADDAGDVSVVQGLVAAISPLFPSVPADSVALAALYVPAALSVITDDHITDKRAHIQSPPAEGSDWTPVRALTDVTKSNDASLTADTALHFPMVSGGKYAIRGHIVLTTPSGSGNARFGFLGPNSPFPTFVDLETTMVRSNALTTQTPTTYMRTALDVTGNVISSTSGANYGLSFHGIVHNSTDTTPDFAFAWGQGAAVVENLVRRAGSYLEYVEL